MIQAKMASLRLPLLFATLCSLPLAGAPAEEPDEATGPQSCLRQANIRKTEIIDSRHIEFVARDGNRYVNELVRECPSIRRNSLLSYPIESGQLCAGTTFAVLWEMGTNRVPVMMCRLGLFLPRTEDEVAELKAIAGDSRRSRRRMGRDMIETAPVELPTPTQPSGTDTP